VLGPPLAGGRLVGGRIIGLMLMEDEKGIDSKVVVSRIRRDGQILHALTEADKDRIGKYFDTYKRHEPGGFSNVPGWGSADDGLAHVEMTHAFFLRCRSAAPSPCRVDPRE
jgi:inorganic pyrophosphatase